MYAKLGFESETLVQAQRIVDEQLEFQLDKRRDARRVAPRTAEGDLNQAIAFRGESFSSREVEEVVAERIRVLLDDWHVGAGDVVMCGARRGSEILFAAECRARGAEVRLLLPLKKSAFVAEAVITDNGDWETRFYDLVGSCEVPGLSSWGQDQSVVRLVRCRLPAPPISVLTN